MPGSQPELQKTWRASLAQLCHAPKDKVCDALRCPFFWAEPGFEVRAAFALLTQFAHMWLSANPEKPWLEHSIPG